MSDSPWVALCVVARDADRAISEPYDYSALAEPSRSIQTGMFLEADVWRWNCDQGQVDGGHHAGVGGGY